ncbi:MAG: hypothetical protein AAB947_00990, partial [Patescibacteria group bacterium]
TIHPCPEGREFWPGCLKKLYTADQPKRISTRYNSRVRHAITIAFLPRFLLILMFLGIGLFAMPMYAETPDCDAKPEDPLCKGIKEAVQKYGDCNENPFPTLEKNYHRPITPSNSSVTPDVSKRGFKGRDGHVYTGLDTVFACRLKILLESAQLKNCQLKITSAMRPEQKCNPTGGACANQGNSCHQYGRAVDIDDTESCLKLLTDTIGRDTPNSPFGLQVAYEENGSYRHVQCSEHLIAHYDDPGGCNTPCGGKKNTNPEDSSKIPEQQPKPGFLQKWRDYFNRRQELEQQKLEQERKRRELAERFAQQQKEREQLDEQLKQRQLEQRQLEEQLEEAKLRRLQLEQRLQEQQLRRQQLEHELEGLRLEGRQREQRRLEQELEQQQQEQRRLEQELEQQRQEQRRLEQRLEQGKLAEQQREQQFERELGQLGQRQQMCTSSDGIQVPCSQIANRGGPPPGGADGGKQGGASPQQALPKNEQPLEKTPLSTDPTKTPDSTKKTPTIDLINALDSQEPNTSRITKPETKDPLILAIDGADTRTLAQNERQQPAGSIIDNPSYPLTSRIQQTFGTNDANQNPPQNANTLRPNTPQERSIIRTNLNTIKETLLRVLEYLRPFGRPSHVPMAQ